MDKGAVTGVVKGSDKKFMRKLAIWAVVLVVGVTVGEAVSQQLSRISVS